MKKILAFVVFLSSFATTMAQDFSLYQKKQFILSGDTMPYRILLPENYQPQKKYPLILFLHGAGERGDDNEKQLIHGGSLFLQDSIRAKYPAIVIFPQCSKDSYWSNVTFQYDSTGKRIAFLFKADSLPTKAMYLVMQLMKKTEQDYKINPGKKYVGGLSMGGMGTFEIARRMPETFAAAFAICGGANTATATQIKNTAWWIFHGLKDDVVNPEYSIRMADSLKNAGAEVKLTLYPDANHNSWDDAVKEAELIPWLWSHSYGKNVH